ncbi:MAG TPA: FAD-binding oxidoreductase [Thermoleophilaceae bacterium]|nr:FAD-binding oxidoreductase [Thermoleophilaceae bacterium]
MGGRRLKHWGWGYEDQQPAPAQVRDIALGLRAHLGFGEAEVDEPVPLKAVELRPPRVDVPDALAEIAATDDYSRASCTLGKAYRDVVRGFRGRYDEPPDAVLRPRDEPELERALHWACSEDIAVIPFGGGTSVVGGIEPRGLERAVTIDLRALDRVLEVDSTARAARIQAGATGPELENQLREHGLTLRHFPQSFEYSTLGGWIATRAGGHFATLMTHIDDLVESVRALTPGGWWESRRLPGSGAGPSPDRMLIGSEGALGVITEAWVRLQERPRFKASAGVLFDTFAAGAEAVRALSQSGLWPSNCRLLDEGEGALTMAAPDGKALLVLGFESADHPVEPWLERALELTADHGGEVRESRGGDGEDSVGAWRNAFVQAPYLRDSFVAGGVISETFETAITWDRWSEFVGNIRTRAEAAVADVCGAGQVTCRFTHVYPDGPAPYFTILAPAERGGEIDQWDAIKTAVSDAIAAGGGTITHHHAVGRDHRPWYDRQRPEPFAAALRAVKAEWDPAGILNPGVLIDPRAH